MFGTEEDIVEYNKLVRDGIPGMIEKRGERVEVVKLSGDAFLLALRQKLVEESLEALDAKSGDDLVGELSDIEEVIRAISQVLQVRKGRIEAERKDKRKRRGSFNAGFMLRKTSTPHTLQRRHSPSTELGLGLNMQDLPKEVISEAADLPAKPVYRRPDLRHVDRQPEKLLTFETEVNKIGALKETIEFSMPINGDVPREFNLTIEMRRNGPTLRGIVRLRPGPLKSSSGDLPDLQLKIDFPSDK